MTEPLTGRVAVVTSANRGIGHITPEEIRFAADVIGSAVDAVNERKAA
jgi:hypothetical protein